MNKKKVFNEINELKDFTENLNGNAKLERVYVKEELLNQVPFAIFFNLCEDFNLTNNESLFLIQTIANKTFRNNGKKLFTNSASKEKMIRIWDIMKKFYTNKLIYYFSNQNEITITNSLFSNEKFTKQIEIGMSQEAKINKKTQELESILNNEFYEDKELLYQVALFCIKNNSASINSIQNKFFLGFNKTLEILDELEKRNVLSPKQGVKGRKILIDVDTLRKIFDK